jgi:hypothetical protein
MRLEVHHQERLRFEVLLTGEIKGNHGVRTWDSVRVVESFDQPAGGLHTGIAAQGHCTHVRHGRLPRWTGWR